MIRRTRKPIGEFRVEIVAEAKGMRLLKISSLPGVSGQQFSFLWIEKRVANGLRLRRRIRKVEASSLSLSGVQNYRRPVTTVQTKIL
jgi:hypothetical protein